MTDHRMPAAFLGHGNPMNALEHNKYTEAWRSFGESDPGRRVSEIDPPPPVGRRVALDGPIRANATVAVESLAQGTRSRVRFTLDFHGPGIGRLMVPQVRRMADKAAPKSRRRLKELLESQDARG